MLEKLIDRALFIARCVDLNKFSTTDIVDMACEEVCDFPDSIEDCTHLFNITNQEVKRLKGLSIF